MPNRKVWLKSRKFFRMVYLFLDWISFHDWAEVLEQILTEYPQIEVVQIQFNYLDYDDLAVESRKCYEVCRKFGKPVLVMGPIKGGSLVNLPEEAKEVFAGLNGGSPASYALRFAAGFYYNNQKANRGKASDCIKCGKCEKICPQHLSIRSLLEDVAKEFEK